MPASLPDTLKALLGSHKTKRVSGLRRLRCQREGNGGAGWWQGRSSKLRRSLIKAKIAAGHGYEDMSVRRFHTPTNTGESG